MAPRVPEIWLSWKSGSAWFINIPGKLVRMRNYLISLHLSGQEAAERDSNAELRRLLDRRHFETGLLRGVNEQESLSQRPWKIIMPVGMFSLSAYISNIISHEPPSWVQAWIPMEEYNETQAVRQGLSFLQQHQHCWSVEVTLSQLSLQTATPSSYSHPLLMLAQHQAWASVLVSSTTCDIIHIFHFKYL